MRFIYTTACLLCFASGLSAQQTTPVSDINPGPSHAFPQGIFDDEQVQVAALDGKLYFAADDGVHGAELWVSDGTPEGTNLLKDINPGPQGSDIYGFRAYNGKLYFAADDGAAGIELWVSDGTEAGTFLFKDLRPGPADSRPSFLTTAGGLLYFSADQSGTGPVLWRSDGMGAGTVTINTNPPFNNWGPDQLTPMNGKLYFTGPDAELWVSDGSDAGTLRVKEITPPGFSPPYIEHMRSIAGKLWFSAHDKPGNSEPWVSDGTETGTLKLMEIEPGEYNGSFPSRFHLFKGQVYFSANNRLWRSDGTAFGTALFKDIVIFPSSSDPAYFVSNTDYLFFPADDFSNGIELWRTDGTLGGTVMVKNINPDDLLGSNPNNFILSPGGVLYFSAASIPGDMELWKSDGTTAGTDRVADIRPGINGSSPTALTRINETIFFVANDGILGRELWKLDLTTGVTSLVWSKTLCSFAPNPARDLLQVTFRQEAAGTEYRLRLYNASGQTAYAAENVSGSVHIMPVGHLPPGLYSLEVISGQTVQYDKVLIAP